MNKRRKHDCLKLTFTPSEVHAVMKALGEAGFGKRDISSYLLMSYYKFQDSDVGQLVSNGWVDSSTGGGLVAWTKVDADFTFEIVTMDELSLARDGDHVAINVHGTDRQLASLDIEKFEAKRVSYITHVLDRYIRARDVKAWLKANPSDILYMNEDDLF